MYRISICVFCVQFDVQKKYFRTSPVMYEEERAAWRPHKVRGAAIAAMDLKVPVLCRLGTIGYWPLIG